MDNRQLQIVSNVDNNREMILEAERWLWAHPQTGYTEWEAHGYLAEKFEKLGYKLTLAGNIPGFFTDIDTGKPGPKLCIIAEMDALDIANHPESVNGMAHCCGHHTQMAALIGIAVALKKPGALDGMSGSIRLMAVPAEELIQLNFREQLRKDGTINYMGGKIEFMYRGYFDDVDIALMAHGGINDKENRYDFNCNKGYNGCIAKMFKFKGKSSHAGGSPEKGINAQYAAMLGLQACNDLRETFRDAEAVRFHPIMLGVNSAVNIIPDEMKMESFVRGNTMEAMKRENNKINRALTGAALALGAGVELCDRPGYSPENHDPHFMRLVEKCCADLVGADRISFAYDGWSTGSSDFGDLTCVMPGVQFNSKGATGTLHGIDFCVADPNRLCLNSAKAQLLVADALLSNSAAEAKSIIENYKPIYPSIKTYFESVDELIIDKDAVIYDEKGNATVDFLK